MSRIYIVALVLVVLFAVAKWTVFKGEDLTYIPTPEQLAFQCMKCDHAWEVPTPDAAAWYPGGMANDYTRVPCPDCDTKSALLKRRCMWCREGYVPKPNVLKVNQDNDPKNDLPEICPHCQKDVMSFPRPD